MSMAYHIVYFMHAGTQHLQEASLQNCPQSNYHKYMDCIVLLLSIPLTILLLDSASSSSD